MLNEQSDEEIINDLVACIGTCAPLRKPKTANHTLIDRMDILMTDLSGNAKLRPIIDDGEADVALWNKEIAKYFQGRRTFANNCSLLLTHILEIPGQDFMNAPWLFAEAYPDMLLSVFSHVD